MDEINFCSIELISLAAIESLQSSVALSSRTRKIYWARTIQFPFEFAPMSYGIRVSEPWDPMKHDPVLDDQFWDPRTRMMLARNQVKWLIRKVSAEI